MTLNLPDRKQSEATMAPWKIYFSEVAEYINNGPKRDWPIHAECDLNGVSSMSPENPSLSFVMTTPHYEERYILIAEGNRVQLAGTAKSTYETESILTGSVAVSFKTAWLVQTQAYADMWKVLHFVRPMGETMLGAAMTDYKGRPLLMP